MIIGLCGGSGSGKTSLVEKISAELDPNNITILSMDDYYKTLDKQSKDKNGEVNFDLPSAIDIERIVSDLKKLKNGESVELLEYTFNNPAAEPKSKYLEPNKIVIIEGIFLFYFQEVLDLVDFSVYINVDLNLQYERRMKRDLMSRGYSEEQINYQWTNHVVPCFENYILPFASKADIVLNNNSHNDFNIEPVLNKIHLSFA